MDSVADIVFFHARTPTLLPFACESVMRAFIEYPGPRRQQYARDYVVSRWSGWHAAIRLSVHGLLEGVTDSWLKRHFEGDVMDFVVKDAHGLYTKRKKFEHYYSNTSIRWHYCLCRPTLKRAGLLRLAPPEWCATRFEAEDLGKALIQGGHSGMGREWYEKTLQKEPRILRRVLSHFGLVSPRPTRDDYAKDLWGTELVNSLDAAGFLNGPGDGREWLANNLTGHCLVLALERAGLLTGEVEREWYVQHLTKGRYPERCALIGALDKAGLLTAECGRDWYAKHFHSKDLLVALEKSGLLTSECGLPWYVAKFEDHEYGMRFQAVRPTGLMQTCTRDELVDAFSDRNLYFSLEHGGKLVPDDEYDRDWYADRLPSKYLIRALRRTGLLTKEPGRDWYVGPLKGHHLFDALDEAGLLTAEPGAQWYVDAFSYKMYAHADSVTLNVRLLHKALKQSGLLTAEKGRDWYMSFAKGKIYRADHPVLSMLRDAGLLTPEAGSAWYERHFRGKALCDALDESGLLPRDETLEWYANRFKDRAIFEVLARTGAVRKITDEQFVKDNICWYSDRLEKYRDMALYRAGLLNDDGSHRWFASHLEGEDLYDALKTNGLLRQDAIYYKWYCYRFKGDLLLRCLKETGDIPHMSTKHIHHFFEDAEWDEATRIKRDFWRGRRYPYPGRPSGPTYFGYDRDDDWCVRDTDSKNSAGYESSFRESITSSDVNNDWPRGDQHTRSDVSHSEYSFFVSDCWYGESYER